MRKTCDLNLAELTVLGCDTREIFCCVIVGGVFFSREEEQEVCDSFCANGTWSMLRSLFLSGRWPGEWSGLLWLLFSFDGVENALGVLGNTDYNQGNNGIKYV